VMIDAPWHYAPTAEGRPARTIEQCPLEWFFSDGVVLDLRYKRPGERIAVQDLEAALAAIGHTLAPLEIVLLMTGRDRHLGTREYFDQPGMTREGTLWLVEQGIKVIGIDAYGFDRKFEDMAAEFRETGDATKLWEAHFAGIEREYCQIEKLVNLDRLPRPTGFKVACFPIKVEGGTSRLVPRRRLRLTERAGIPKTSSVLRSKRAFGIAAAVAPALTPLAVAPPRVSTRPCAARSG
jgi:kynurenine formamidase